MEKRVRHAEKWGEEKLERFWRPAWVEVNSDAIQHNVKEIRRHVGPRVQVFAVIKGDAYGHGAVEVARRALEAGADRLAVANLEEGLELRRAGITAPVLVLGYVPAYQLLEVVRNDLTIALYLTETATTLAAVAKGQGKKVRVHLKVDTGMNRIGVRPDKAVEFARYVRDLGGIEIEGVFTHFASAARPDKSEAEKQYSVFAKTLLDLRAAGFAPPLCHAANSAAIMEMPHTHLTAVRAGRLLYGYYPYAGSPRVLDLRPALELKCEIACVKAVEEGQGVGYDAAYRPQKATTIVTLPLGFTDGLSRQLAGICPVLIAGEKKRIVAFCADMCMVDVGESNLLPKVGDEAVIIGKQGQEVITVDELADLLGVSLGQVLCQLSRRLPRVYVRGRGPYLVRLPDLTEVSLD